MNEFKTEEEQVEALKKWWSENGTSLILSVVVVAGGWLGWNTYQDNVRATGEAASAVYSQLVDKAAQPSAEQTDAVKAEMISLAEQLKKDFSSTVYSQFGGLFLARFAADNGDFETAVNELKSVIAAADEGPVKLTAQVRLANILVQLDKNDEALALIPAQPDAAYAAQFQEVKGDALYRKGDMSEARSAYVAAKAAAQEAGISTQVLQRKIDNLTSVELVAEES
ncbi:MAG: tetratricopeptide repeat protein [Saccharospirillaceae bacterium]|nr:tetratricopeptide repeat protein [Saccharospirillaceae bacterium]